CRPPCASRRRAGGSSIARRRCWRTRTCGSWTPPRPGASAPPGRARVVIPVESEAQQRDGVTVAVVEIEAQRNHVRQEDVSAEREVRLSAAVVELDMLGTAAHFPAVSEHVTQSAHDGDAVVADVAAADIERDIRIGEAAEDTEFRRQPPMCADTEQLARGIPVDVVDVESLVGTKKVHVVANVDGVLERIPVTAEVLASRHVEIDVDEAGLEVVVTD